MLSAAIKRRIISKVKNKVTFGLKNVYYSKITETSGANGVEVVYATPVPMPGGASMSMPKNAERVAIAADDDPEYAVFYNNKGYDGNIVLYDVPDSFYVDCLGETSDGNTMVENKDDAISDFALGFQIEGDSKGRRFWFYNVSANRPSTASQTIETSKEPVTDTLDITASARITDGNVKVFMEESATNTAEYNGFFTSVYEAQ